MIAAATIEATIATGECRKLQRRSLSKNPRSRPGAAPSAAAAVALVEAVSSSDTGEALALDPQPRVDHVIEEIDDEVDHHKEEPDQHQIGGHHRDICEGHRLDE